jgi:DedD protein
MALFKFRQGEDSPQAAPAQTVEVVRQRAKHRLIGAVVLVTLGVVGFPLLVDKQPRPMSVDLPIDIPDKNKTKPLTLPAAAPAAASAPASPAPSTPPQTQPATLAGSAVPAAASLSHQEAIEPKTPKAELKAEPKAEPKAEAKVEAKADSKPDSKPAVKPSADKPNADSGSRALALLEGKDLSKTEAKVDARWVIQVGAFDDAKKVNDVRAKLERAGLKTYTQVVDAKDGKRTRVRLGPFATKAEADKAVDKIKKLELTASILTL